jgi:type I restriction enzyme S subunit
MGKPVTEVPRQKAEFKESEIELVPGEWKICPLESVALNFDKQRIPLNEIERTKRKGTYPYCGANGIVDYLDDYIFDGEYVLLAEDGGYWGPGERSAYLMSGRFWVNNHAHILQAIDGQATNPFLAFALNHLNIDPLIGGDARGKLTQAVMRTIPIPIPPLPEQRAIAAVLSKIQAAAEVEVNLITTLRDLKTATMAKLFREGLRGEPLKVTEIGEIPESWHVKPLDTLSQISTGTTPSTSNPNYYVGDVPFVKTAEIDNNFITKSQSHISRRAVQDYSLRLYPTGSVFLAMYGQGKTRGRAALLGIPATTTQNTAAIEPSSALNGEFLWHYLLSQYETLRGMGNLGHLSHLNLGYVKTLPIPLPPVEEQIEIKTVLSRLQIRAEIANQRYRVLNKLFSSMLHLLMTGKVRVNSTLTRTTELSNGGE